MDELIVILKGEPLRARSAFNPECEFSATPFLGFFRGFAGVGYLDENGEHAISNCTGTVVGSMPIIKAWRVFKLLPKFDKHTDGTAYLAWLSELEPLKKMAAEGVDIVAVHGEIMTSLPSEEEIVHIFTETLLAGKWVDVKELTEELSGAGGEIPKVAQAFSQLMGVIYSQDLALSRIKYQIQEQLRSINNPYAT